MDETPCQCVTIQMKTFEQYFHVVLFIVLCMVVLTFRSVDKTIVCYHSNESYRAVLSCGTVYYAGAFNAVDQDLGYNNENKST